MGVWDTITACMWFNQEYQRNTIASMLAGFLVCIEKEKENESYETYFRRKKYVILSVIARIETQTHYFV